MKRVVTIGILLIVGASSLSAQSATEAHIRQHVGQAAARIQTMQCDFTQTKHLRMLNDRMTSRGKMYYQRSDKLRWEYTSPYGYLFLMNGGQVLLKSQQCSDIIDTGQNKMLREIAQMMMNSMVGGLLADERNFKTSIGESQGEYVATLLPQRKNMRRLFKCIVLHFRKQDATVWKVELIERNDDRTTIELTHIRVNETISANQFAVH